MSSGMIRDAGAPVAPVAVISGTEGEMDALLLGRTGVRQIDHYRNVCTDQIGISNG